MKNFCILSFAFKSQIPLCYTQSPNDIDIYRQGNIMFNLIKWIASPLRKLKINDRKNLSDLRNLSSEEKIALIYIYEGKNHQAYGVLDKEIPSSLVDNGFIDIISNEKNNGKTLFTISKKAKIIIKRYYFE